MDRWSAIRQAARQTLAAYECRASKPAFTATQSSGAILKDLAKRCLQLSIIEDPDLPEYIHGVLNLEEGTISTHPTLPPTRHAFVIAHEIGHYALKHPIRQIADHAEDIDDQPHVAALTVQDGVYRAYSERDRLELEANIFAAELLAPIEQVRVQVAADPQWTVDGLAAYFGISSSAMLNQLMTALLLCPTVTHEPPLQKVAPLDERQQEAATVAPPALVMAGPGAGKTRVLVERFAHLVRNGTDPRRILALTFSNKAAEEMRERLSLILPERAHEIQVATFHSLGLELLQAYGHCIGLKDKLQILTEVDAYVFLQNRLSRLPLGNFATIYQPAQHLVTILQAISRAKDELVSPEEFEHLVVQWQIRLEQQQKPFGEGDASSQQREIEAVARCRDVAAIYKTYQQWLREEGLVDYGDLITEAVRLFSMPSVAAAIRGCYDHVLVDEFQDINYASGRLVHALDGGRGIVWAVGDPRQSIYRFRGASPLNLAHFAIDYPGAKVISLAWNYRSVEGIVKAGEAVDFPSSLCDESASTLRLKSQRGNPIESPAIEVVVADNTESEIATLVERVKDAMLSTSPGQIAVLCRQRALAQKVAEALETQGVPTNWGGQLDERPLFKDIMAVLLLAADDMQGLLRLSRISEHSFSRSDLQLLLTEARQCSHSVQAVLRRASEGGIAGLSPEGRAQAHNMKQLATALSYQPTPWRVLASYLFEHARWPRKLFTDSSPAARRDLATLSQIAGLTRDFDGRTTFVGSEDTKAFLAFVKHSLEAGHLDACTETVNSPDTVNVLTIHGSKGLEWQFVLVPDLVEDKYQHPPLPLPPDLIRGEDAANDVMEEACLFYVALTRARDHSILLRSERHGRKLCTPKRFLQHLITALKPTGHLQQTYVSKQSVRTSPGTQPQTILGSTINPSHRILVEFERCSQKVKFQHIYGLKDEENGYRLFHQVVYGVMAWIAEQAANNKPLHPDAVQEMLNSWWLERGPVEHRFESIYRRYAEQAVSVFAQRLRPGARIALRQKMTVPIGNRDVEFIVDEIEEGPLRIYRRHHFGHPSNEHKQEHLLSLLVAAQAQQKDTQSFSVRLHYLLSGHDEEVMPTARVVSNRLAKMKNLMAEVEAGSFRPNPSALHCPYCRFNLICPS